jgi:phage terminase large subunit-like protein
MRHEDWTRFDDGAASVTSGNETDFDEIERDVRQLRSRFNVVSAGYDHPWQSAQMSQRLRMQGCRCMNSRRRPQIFSSAIIEPTQQCGPGRLRHDGNPVLEWCLGNVVGKADRRGNL